MRRSFLFVTLTSIAVLVGVMTTVSPARAAAPENFTVEVDDSFSFDDCGFTIEGRITGFLRVHTFFDQEGNVVMAINNFSLKITYTNPETGETLTYPIVGPDIVTLHEDGSATIASIGIITRVGVPGGGLVAAQIGNIVFFFTDPADEEPDVIFLAGPHGGDELAAVCEALAP
jgi:hypothetical protein